VNYLFTFVTTLAVIFQGCSSLHSSSFFRLESTLKKSHLALDSTEQDKKHHRICGQSNEYEVGCRHGQEYFKGNMHEE
jgi:hypothetical protein